MQGEGEQSLCTAWSGEGKAEISSQLSPCLTCPAHAGFWKCLHGLALGLARAAAAPPGTQRGERRAPACPTAAAAALLSPPCSASPAEPQKGPDAHPSAPGKDKNRVFATG